MMCCAITSPVKEPSLRRSTRSLAPMSPRTSPRTTTSRAEIFPETCPLRPIVTRLPGKLIVPLTLPSIYSDSEPITSPLTSRLLSIVAWAEVAGDALVEVGRMVIASGLAAMDPDGCVGSMVGDGEGGTGWFCSSLMVDKFVFNSHILSLCLVGCMRPY